FMITSHLPIKLKDKQKVLETDDIKQRLQSLLTIITNEQKVLDLEHKIGKRVQTSMEKTQKEYYLCEQMKAILKELYGVIVKFSETDQLRKDINIRDYPVTV